jgi:hypothetical protein
MKYIPVCLALMTPGCAVYERSFPSYEYSMVTVCRTAADTIDVLAVRHIEDPLTADQIGTVKDAIGIIENVCMQEDIPDDEGLLLAARQSVKDLLKVEEQTR